MKEKNVKTSTVKDEFDLAFDEKEKFEKQYPDIQKSLIVLRAIVHLEKQGAGYATLEDILKWINKFHPYLSLKLDDLKLYLKLLYLWGTLGKLTEPDGTIGWNLNSALKIIVP